MSNTTQIQKDVLKITRIFDGPREAVWKAWSEPERVKRWWGPRIFTSPSCKIDFRVGGKYLFCMQTDTGPEVWRKGIWSTGIYKEIVPMEKIVYTDSFADDKGQVVSPEYYGMKDFPAELIVTLNFEHVDTNKTKMILQHAGLPTEMQKECQVGWNESLDKLNKIL